MLFDTDVLVWVTRGHGGANRVTADPALRAISVVSYMELVAGAKDRRDMNEIRASLHASGFEIVQITPAISQRGAMILEDHVLATGIDLADALIAATCIEYSQPLCTGNVKHFGAIKGLELKAFKP